MRRLWLLSIAVVLVASGNTALAAGQATTAADIRKAAAGFLTQYQHAQAKQGRKVDFSIGVVDPRLRLAPCDQPLDFDFQSDPLAATRVTLQAQCNGKRPWRMYLNAAIEIKAEAYITKMPLARGTRLTADMLDKQFVTINRYRQSIYQNTDGLVGMDLVRPVSAGTLITADLLTAPTVVARGDRVIINAHVGSIVVSTRGTALTDGHMGQQILVRNERSKRTVQAVVTGPEAVTVPM